MQDVERRDKLAETVLGAILMGPDGSHKRRVEDGVSDEMLAVKCYRIADAMMEAREPRDKTALELHAEREMRLAGLYDKGADYDGLVPAAVMAMIKAHSDQGHSGGSHQVTMELFDKLVRFKTLTPLTNDPEEWNDVSEMTGKPSWQSRRDSEAFSTDGGKTYYLLADPEKIIKAEERGGAG
jgi:hypothetical protein